MKRQISFLSILFLLSGTLLLQAQPNIKVPEKLKFADLQLELDDDARDAVQKKVNGLTRSQRFYDSFIDRCNIYFPIIEEAFKEERLPEDFKFLALQESALIPDAVSKSNAVGYWQFKDFTAKELGLRINQNVDERKSIVASSHAAARYLKKNNRFLRNWVYALLSYNLGLTGANNISDRSKIGAERMTLTKTTHVYIIHFLAHKIAFENAVNKSTSLFKLMEYPQASGKTIEEIAKLSKLDASEIDKYNRWLKAPKVPSDRDYHFLLPVPMKRVKELKEKLNLDQKGELIAKNDTDRPKDRDKDKSKDKDKTNKTLKTKSAYPKITHKKTQTIGKQKITFANINGIHGFITEEKPNLFEIISSLKISRKKFMKVNDMKTTDEIEANEIYYLKSKKGKAMEDFHVTQAGQTLHDIAQMYGIKEKALIKKNRMRAGEDPQPGRVLWLKRKRPKKVPIEIRDVKPKKEETPKKDDGKKDDGKKDTKLDNILDILDEDDTKDDGTPDKIITNGRFHVVKRGETLYAISREYKLSILKLKELNNLGEDLAIKEGQILIVRENTGNTGSLGGEAEADLDDIIGESIKIDPEGNVIDSVISIKKNPNDNNGGTGGTGNFGNNTYNPQVTTHTVKPRENLYSIARIYKVTHRNILEWNNIDPLDVLKIGQVLVVSDPNAKVLTNNDHTGGTKMEMREVKKHQIQRGETLYGIARQYKLDVRSLIKWNKLDQNSVISVGQELFLEDPVSYNQKVIENSLSNTNVAEEKPIYHVVRASDNLPTIAYKYGVSVNEILDRNNLTKTDILVEGQTLLIKDVPRKKAPDNNMKNYYKEMVDKHSNKTVTTSVNQPIVHVVNRGETLWGISQKYSVHADRIKHWNKLSSNTLTSGQRLIVGYKRVGTATDDVDKTKSTDGPNVSKASSSNKGDYIGSDGNTSNTNSGSQYHTVSKGDTLYSISRKYNLKVTELKAMNPNLSAILALGQKIRIR